MSVGIGWLGQDETELEMEQKDMALDITLQGPG